MAEKKQWQAFSNELAETAEEVGRSVVAVQARHRHASSGVLWRKQAIVTADHTIRRDQEITVILAGGESASASLVGRDASTDLAVLRLEKEVSVLLPKTGGAPELKIGHFVLAVGRTRRGAVVASSGIISGLMGPWRTWRGGEIQLFIRPDLVMYPGFSGGPLVNAQGQVLGINTSGLRRGPGVTIPSATVDRVVDELLQRGHIARPYLGLGMQPVPLPESLRGKLSLNTSSALLVVHVEPGGPADQAGVLMGDLLLELTGKPVGDTDDVQEVLRSSKIGETVDAGFIRGGTRTNLSIRLEERPRA